MQRGERLAEFCRGRGPLWLALVLAFALGAPSLDFGLVFDDHVFADFLRAHIQGPPPALPLWDMFAINRVRGPFELLQRIYFGMSPWWTSPEYSLCFFRPLAVLTHYVDYRLWPNLVWLMHAHNVAWYAATVVVVGLLYRRLSGASAASALGLIMYAVDDAHREGLEWLAGRNTLMTACFVALALLLHDRARQKGDRRAAFGSVLSLLCGLASSEGAIAIWAYLVPYAWLIDTAAPRARLRALMPAAVVTVVWQALYRGLGYGAHGTGLYVDPLDAPSYFAKGLLERYPLLVREQFGFPQTLYAFAPQWSHAWLNASWLVLLLLAGFVLWQRVSRRRVVLFWAIGAALSLVPICATNVAPRLLFVASFGAFGALGELIAGALEPMPAAPRIGPAWLSQALALSLLALHGVLPLAMSIATPETGPVIDAAVAKSAESLPWGPEQQQRVVALLNTPNYFATILAIGFKRDQGSPGPKALHLLGSSATPVVLSRPDEHTLILRPEGGYLVESTSMLVRRADEPFMAGGMLPLLGLWVRVDEITSDGRPAQVRLMLDPDPHKREPITWAVWDNKQARYRVLDLPPVGGSMTLP